MPNWRSSIASRITMAAAEFELGESIQSSHSYRVARSPIRIGRRVSVLVFGSKMRTVCESDCEKLSAVTTVFFSTRLRASMSFG